MMEVILQPPQSFPVTVGGVTLYLSGWKTAGICVLREQCTADGIAGVTASFPKGTRLTMEGRLAPEEDAGAVTAALAQRLIDGTTEDLTVRGVVYAGARLCSYTVSEGQEAAQAVLVFYTEQQPVIAESGDA